MKKAFTMAEILLSLTIIGVVAAITLPSLTGNINERTWNTQRKALYARMSQAIALMPALNGYGTVTAATESASAVDTAAETFVASGLSKVLKINNICDNEHLADCGIPTTINDYSNSQLTNSDLATLVDYNNMFSGSFDTGSAIIEYNSQTNTKSVAFETQNGESIIVFYNPQCQPDLNETSSYFTQTKMCANFIYDLNGSKGPNTMGKDIGFITALYSTDSIVVAPMPLMQKVSSKKKQNEASKACTEQDPDSRLPNREEISAMFYNKALLGEMTGGYWSSTFYSGGIGSAWFQSFDSGANRVDRLSENKHIRCVKR